MVMNIQAEVFCVVTPCSVAEGPSPWRWRQQDPPKRWYLGSLDDALWTTHIIICRRK